MITWHEICEKIEQYNGIRADGQKRIEFVKNEPMSRHTTFRIGGSAALYTICRDTEALIWLIDLLRNSAIKFFIVGNGSNLLFADEEYDGVIIDMTAMQKISCSGNILTCDAGCSMASMAKKAREYSLTGLEFLYGIPGTCGGGVYMNAGAYDGEMENVVKQSTYLDTLTGEIHTLAKEEHCYSYRSSLYRAHPEWIVLSAELELKPGVDTEITAKMEDFMFRRKSKQPLEYPSAGSVFKRYPGRYTAQMIDEAGLKGYQIGGAQVSEKHAGFIINKGGASCADVLMLIQYIQEVIRKKYNVQIECEIIQVK